MNYMKKKRYFVIKLKKYLVLMFSSSTIDKNFVIKLQAFAIFKLKYNTFLKYRTKKLKFTNTQV